jgi:hypothetical protein
VTLRVQGVVGCGVARREAPTLKGRQRAASVDCAKWDETRVGPSHENILVTADFDGEVFHCLVK